MFRWAPFAMVRVTMFLVAGILTAIHAGNPPGWSTYILALLALIFLVCLILKAKAMCGFAGLAIVFLLGLMLVQQRGPKECDLTSLDGEVLMYEAVISRFAEERAKTWRTEAAIQAVRTRLGWQNACGSVLVYLPKEGRLYEYGDVLMIRGGPALIPAPANPGEFDFRRYMSFKGIHHQHFLRHDSITWVRNDPQSFFLHQAIHVRRWADAKIKSVVVGQREQATATALVLGVTDGLDNELLQAYASTGALHVLAVSGLHVSIIYWIILLVLKPLDRTKSMKWLLAWVSVFVLWSYAFVSGWSPSVLRAVTMFSFIAFSRPWRQTTNIYNTLASSMFCLLLYDPFFIMSVGFQLSYLAVFGIVFLQPRLYALWEPRHRILDEVWKLSSVSIAAQIATLPIGLYYFHQFPNYFLPANLVVIPVSFVVLVAGLAISAFAFVDPLIVVLGWILTWAVRLMNFLVFTFDRLPYSVIDGIYISQLQCIVLACLIAAATLLLIQKKFLFLPVALIFAVWLSVLQWHHFMKDVNVNVTRVYSIAGHTLVNNVRQGNSRTVADTSARSDWGKMLRYLEPALTRGGARNDSVLVSDLVLSKYGCRVWLWDDVALLQISNKRHTIPTAIVSFVIISNNSVATLSELSTVKCEKIIVDSSNSFYFAERLQKEAIAQGIPLWSVLHDGAFEYNHAKR